MKSILIEKPIRKLTAELLTIPDRVEYIRCILGYPVLAFERTLGLKNGTYKNYVHYDGKHFRLDTVDKIEQVMGVNKDFILTGAKSAYPKNGYEEFIYKNPKDKRFADTTDVEVGARVREIRAESGLIGALFAAKLDISPDQLYKIENGTNQLQIRTVNKLVKVFGIPDPWILRGEGRKRGV